MDTVTTAEERIVRSVRMLHADALNMLEEARDKGDTIGLVWADSRRLTLDQVLEILQVNGTI